MNPQTNGTGAADMEEDSEDEAEREVLLRRLAEMKQCRGVLEGFSTQLQQRLVSGSQLENGQEFSKRDYEVLRLKHAALLRDHAALKRNVVAVAGGVSPPQSRSENGSGAAGGGMQIACLYCHGDVKDNDQRLASGAVVCDGCRRKASSASPTPERLTRPGMGAPKVDSAMTSEGYSSPQSALSPQSAMQLGGSSASRPLTITVAKKPFGMDVRELCNTLRVVGVSAGSPAELCGVTRGLTLLSVNGRTVTPKDWLEIYMSATVPFDIEFDGQAEARLDSPTRLRPVPQMQRPLPTPSSANGTPTASVASVTKEGPFGDGFEDFECYIGQRPFGMAADADSPQSLPYIQAVLAGFPAETAGVLRDDVLVAVDGKSITAATWVAAAQNAPLPARFQFRRRSLQPERSVS